MRNGVGYTGHVEDGATGLSYMQQRYYDPQLGLFLSVDPVTAYDQPLVAFNRYRYANNNPYKFFDPDGRFSDDPNRQPRGGLSANQASPEADRINYEKGGAPTGKIAAQMRSGDAGDRLSAAKTAMAVSRIDGDPNALSYNQDLDGASATTDVFGSVELGPDAFVSWSWLSSTLGHEFEVHVPQFESLGGLQGQRDSDSREVQAHQYNLDNAARFRNSPGEVQRHRDLRDGYQHRLDKGRSR
jgi:RHS repeat-associated protein